MQENPGAVTFQGTPLTLMGKIPSKGETAPDFTVIDNQLQPVTLADLSQKILVLSAVPSLDTPVCDMETRKFNQAAEKLGSDVLIATISMDLPFAQARWCAATGVSNVQTFSDYKYASFGSSYGVLIDELRLLARCLFVLDDKRVVRHVQLVKEITNEPDYDAVIATVKALL